MQVAQVLTCVAAAALDCDAITCSSACPRSAELFCIFELSDTAEAKRCIDAIASFSSWLISSSVAFAKKLPSWPPWEDQTSWSLLQLPKWLPCTTGSLSSKLRLCTVIQWFTRTYLLCRCPNCGREHCARCCRCRSCLACAQCLLFVRFVVMCGPPTIGLCGRDRLLQSEGWRSRIAAHDRELR